MIPNMFSSNQVWVVACIRSTSEARQNSLLSFFKVKDMKITSNIL